MSTFLRTSHRAEEFWWRILKWTYIKREWLWTQPNRLLSRYVFDMAVKSGRLVQMTLDHQVLHGIIAFGRFLMLAGGKVSNHCYSFIRIYHWLILFINGGCSTGRNVCFLTMYYCRPWPDVVMITLALYAISTNLLLRIFLIHRNILLKNCSGESSSGHISCDSV